MICKNCIHKEVCKDYSIYKDTIIACEKYKDGTIKNQYDRIRNMSVEELAMRILETDRNENFTCEKYCAYTKDGKCDKFRGDGKGSCQIGIKQWLESEVTE